MKDEKENGSTEDLGEICDEWRTVRITGDSTERDCTEGQRWVTHTIVNVSSPDHGSFSFVFPVPSEEPCTGD